MISLHGRFQNNGRRSQLSSGLLLAILPLMAAACSREPADDRYIARVGTTVLTEAELRRTTDTLGFSGRGKRDMVNDWIITELLYQEAVRRGLADSEPVRRQLDDTRKHLAISALLEEELYLPGDTVGINDDRVAGYLRRSPGTYTLREDVANVSYTFFADRESASAFRSMLLGGASWNDAVARVEADTTLAPRLRRAVVRQYVTQSTLYPQELWKLARTLRNNEVSYVVTTGAGYAVLTLHDIRRQGETPDIDYVRSEVRDRILIEQRRTRFESLVSRLRSRSAVELRLAAPDTARPGGPEWNMK